VLNEEERQGCDAFYATSGIESNDLNENRAFTNKLYQYLKSDADICQNNKQAVGIDNYKVDKETSCKPLGALAINTQATGVIKDLENAFLYNTANDNDEIKWDCDMNTSYPSGGAHCFEDPTPPNKTNIKDNIDSFFAKSYGYFEQKPVVNKDNGYCKSTYASGSDKICTKDKDCKEVEFTESCYAFTAGICSNSSSENNGKNCFSDMDCGADKTMAGKGTDEDKIVIPIRKYCLQLSPQPIDKACTDMDGEFYNLEKNGELNKSGCSVGRWLSNNLSCMYQINGMPETQTITDPSAECSFLTYPSNSTKVSYKQNNNKSWDYSPDNNDKLPTISAVVATTKVDSNGKTIYAAIPNKITITTPDTEKQSGDIVFYGKQLPVSVKFYAWADDDHMPLRSVIVKFEDNVTVGSTDGDSKFKNYKPRCQGTEHEPLGICNKKGEGELYLGYACLEDSDCTHLEVDPAEPCKVGPKPQAEGGAYKEDRFGDTEQACQEGYFQYNHTYTCGADNAIPQLVPGKTEEVWACKFEIGVQAKDNWGWCNGDDVNPNSGPNVDGSKGAYEVNCDIETKVQAAEYYDGYIYMIP
jgi:hypothetical protein